MSRRQGSVAIILWWKRVEIKKNISGMGVYGGI